MKFLSLSYSENSSLDRNLGSRVELLNYVFDDGGSRGMMITISISAVTGAAYFVVLARLYVRAILLKKFGMDDYFMICAILCSGGVLTCVIGEVMLGVGRHITDPWLVVHIKDIWKWLFYHAWINVAGISFVKISVGFFLLRLVQGKWYKRTLITWIAFLFVFTLASVGTLVFQCLPINAAWDGELRQKSSTRCFSFQTYQRIGLFNGAINIFTDFLFTSFPIPIILPLKINLRTKYMLICILSLGYFACAAAVIKEVLLSRFFDDKDPFFSFSLQTWNDIELNVGILAACLPTLRPLFTSLLQPANTSAIVARTTRTHTRTNTTNTVHISAHSRPTTAKSNTNSRFTSMPASSTRGYRITVLGGGRIDSDGKLARVDSGSRRLLVREESFVSLGSGSGSGKGEMEGMDQRLDSGYEKPKEVIGIYKGAVYVDKKKHKEKEREKRRQRRRKTERQVIRKPAKGILRTREAKE